MSTVFVDLLSLYPDDADAHRRYERKPNGGYRPITVPNKSLKKWHRLVLAELIKRHGEWPKYVHGGVKKKSFVTFASMHVNQRLVITVDISKCFDSISGDDIAKVLMRHLRLSKQVSEELAFALCFNNRLAQGFPTSSFICNLYLSDHINKLNDDFIKQGLAFGSYVDDLAVSGVIVNPDVIINNIAVTLSRAHLKVHKAKVRVMPSSGRQTVCGLIVNKRLTISRELEQKLHYDIKNKALSARATKGWIANIQSFDSALSDKFKELAVHSGVIEPDKK